MRFVRVFLLVLLLFSSADVFCRTDSAQSVTSLRYRLDDTKDDTTRVNLLNALSVSYNRINTDTAIAYGRRALSLAQAIKWQAGIAAANNNIGLNALENGEYNTALGHYKSALQIYERLANEAAVVQAYNNIGEVYFRLNKYPQALECYYKALNISEKGNRKTEAAKCLVNIGNIFKSEKNYDKAIVYINKGRLIFETEGKKELVAVADVYIGDIFFELARHDSAMHYYTRALRLAQSVADTRLIARLLENLGNVYSEQGNTALALDYQEKALNLYKELNDRSRVGGILGNIGTTYLLLGQSDLEANRPGSKANVAKGIAYLNEAIPVLQSVREYTLLPQFYENMSDGYSMLGNYKLALESHQLFMLYRDSVSNQQKSKEIAGLELEYEFAKQKDSIKYDKILAEQKLAVEQKSRRLQLVLFSVGILLIGVIAVLIFRSLRTQQKLNGKISQLVNEQEVIIEQRTADLSKTNLKLRDLISFNAHQIREPLTRITGTIQIREFVDQQEYFDEFLPQMEKAAHDLDNAIKDVLVKAQQE